MEDLKELLPWALGIASTVIALKKDLIKSKFTKAEEKNIISSSAEDVEAKALENVEKTMGIYRGMVEDLKVNIGELKGEITELKEEVVDLKDFISEQKRFIAKQNKSLEYYEKKYGKIVN